MFILSSWLANFISRILYVYIITVYLALNRHDQGDENNIVTGLVMTVFGTLFIEAAVYINMKARAHLFLKARTSKQ